VILPPGTSGTLHIPIAFDGKETALKNDNNVEIFIEESGDLVWFDWKFGSSVNGVLDAVENGKSVQLDLSNGKYVFKVTASNRVISTAKMQGTAKIK